MFNTMTPKNLFIDKISTLLYKPKENEVEEDRYIDTFYKLNNYYSESISKEEFLSSIINDRVTNEELSLELLNSIPSSKDIDFFIYCQNQFDNRPLNTPLAAILEKSSLNAINTIGLTHLDNISSVEGLKILANSASNSALLLMTEKVIVNQLPASGMYLGSSSVGLSINSLEGYRITSLSSITTETDGYRDQKQFIEELQSYIKQFTSSFTDYVLIHQNSLTKYDISNGIENCYSRVHDSHLDYQSSDVWITLEEFLNHTNWIGNVILITTNFRHKISICTLQI